MMATTPRSSTTTKMATTPRYTTEASPDVTTASPETGNHSNQAVKKCNMYRLTECGTLIIIPVFVSIFVITTEYFPIK